MLVVEGSVVVDAPLDRVRDVVLDGESYAAADTKVDAVHVEESTADGMIATIDGHLGPIHSSMRVRYTVRDGRVDLDMITGRIRDFHAAFVFEPADGGVRLTHIERYDFGFPLITPLVERAMRAWTTKTVAAEVRALKRAAEAPVEARAAS